MIGKAEKYKNEDKKRRELVDLKNDADNAIHNTEKALNEHRSKLQ
jgi:molecular chaperone DnaK